MGTKVIFLFNFQEICSLVGLLVFLHKIIRSGLLKRTVCLLAFVESSQILTQTGA